MAGSSFLKKLERAADLQSDERSFYRGEDLESSVATHLTQMLNTRAGSCLTAPDFGIIELSELLSDFPEAMGVMQRAIKNTILKYEPRLKNVQVRPLQPDDDESQMFVYFEITAQLVYPNGDRQPIRFSTTVDESSNVTLKA
jgi:type VI secretion system protein